MVTRKDYIAIAEALHEGVKESISKDLSLGVVIRIADTISDYFEGQNPAFNRTTFVEAVMYGSTQA